MERLPSDRSRSPSSSAFYYSTAQSLSSTDAAASGDAAASRILVPPANPNPSANLTQYTLPLDPSYYSISDLLDNSAAGIQCTHFEDASDSSISGCKISSLTENWRAYLPDSSSSSPQFILGAFGGYRFDGSSLDDRVYADDASSGYSRESGGGGRPQCYLSSPSARVKSCDVYIGLCGHKSSLLRFVNWLRAELELQGVLCFVSDRGTCSDAYAHSVARAAMDSATLGVVVVTRKTFSSPYCMEEIRLFLQRKNLVPIFFEMSQGECLPRDIVERRGELWERQGGFLWEAYGGLEKEWKESVNGLYRLEYKLEAHANNWRDCILNAIVLVGTRLGRRGVVEKVRSWKESVEKGEHPFPRNSRFVGREKELLELELILFGDVEGVGGNGYFDVRARRRHRRVPVSGKNVARQSSDQKGKGKEPVLWKESEEEIEMEGALGAKRTHCFPRDRNGARQTRRGPFASTLYGKGIACVSGDSGIGKTELLLEFAYRFSQRYKMVLWVGGEARYLRQNYLNQLPILGIDVSIGSEVCPEGNEPRSFEELEGQVINRVQKELMRDIPFLIMIDNLEGEKDWWDGRNIMDILPRFGGETHIIISTRLPRVVNLEPMRLFYLSGAEAMTLMKGSLRDLPTEEVDALRIIEEKLGRVTLGLAVVGALLSELPISPQKLLDAINRMSYRDLTWGGGEDLVLKHTPYMVQLLDVCFAIFDLADKPRNLASRMVQASGWFAPSPIPIPLLAVAACEVPEGHHRVQFWKKCLRAFSCMCMTSHSGRSEAEASATLVKFQIARSCTKNGYIHFHDIIKVYARKRGNGSVARAMVQAIGIRGSALHHSEHIWAASFLLFKFGTDPAVVDLKVPELIAFIKRCVLPLAMDTFTIFSRCRAALELLRLSTEVLEAMEDSFLSEAKNELERPSCWSISNNRPTTQFDPHIYNEFALLRATLLETRAKLMFRGGLYDIAEQLCSTAISIKEVFYGLEHPETMSTRETMARLKASIKNLIFCNM